MPGQMPLVTLRVANVWWSGRDSNPEGKPCKSRRSQLLTPSHRGCSQPYAPTAASWYLVLDSHQAKQSCKDRARLAPEALNLVCKVGFEPTTTRFQGGDSTRLSYSQIGAVEGDRTLLHLLDRQVTSPDAPNGVAPHRGLEPRACRLTVDRPHPEGPCGIGGWGRSRTYRAGGYGFTARLCRHSQPNQCVERMTGLEPVQPAWKAGA